MLVMLINKTNYLYLIILFKKLSFEFIHLHIGQFLICIFFLHLLFTNCMLWHIFKNEIHLKFFFKSIM